MASFVYNKAKEHFFRGTFTASTDYRVLLVKGAASTTTDTEDDVEFLSGFTTLGESTASGYARQTLASESINFDSANNRVELDATDPAFGALNSDTVGAFILYSEGGGTEATRRPVCYVDTGGFPVVLNGGTFTIQFNAEGILQGT